MVLSNTERQRRWREKHRGEPRGNAAMMAKLAVLEGRVAKLEAQPSARPQPARRKPPERQPAAYAALKQERDELAERLARIVAYDPGIEAKAQAWITQVDAPPRRRKRKPNPPANRPA